MVYILLIVSKFSIGQGFIDVNYFVKHEFLINDTLRNQPVQIDFISNFRGPSLMNQYSIGENHGDTLMLVLGGDSLKFVEYRERSSDFWIFKNQFLQSIDSNRLIRIDSFLIISIDSQSIKLDCFYTHTQQHGIELFQQETLNIPLDKIMGFYVY